MQRVNTFRGKLIFLIFCEKNELYLIENNNYALGLFERDHQEIAHVHLADLV